MKRIKVILKYTMLAFGTLVLSLALFYALTTPTSQGPWKPEYARLAQIDQDGAFVTIHNFRRMRFDSSGQPLKTEWQRRDVDLRDLKSAWFGVSVFGKAGLAHTFLSFDFGDGDPVVISVEARQRPDQQYSPVSGVFDAYPLIYIVADEVDIIGQRTHIRANQVYFQPMALEKGDVQTLFQNIIKRINALKAEPEFYNTLTANCTNSLLAGVDFPQWRRYADPRIMLPGYSDRVAYDFGWLDQRFLLDDLRRIAWLDPADFALDMPDFSTFLRQSYSRRRSDLSPMLP